MFVWGTPQGSSRGVCHEHGWIGPSKLVGVGHTFGLDWGTLDGSKADFSKFDPTGQKSKALVVVEFVLEV